MEAQQIDRFLRERCETVADARVDKATLFAAFCAWAHEKNIARCNDYEFFSLLRETGKVDELVDHFSRIRLRDRYRNPPPIQFYTLTEHEAEQLRTRLRRAEA